MQILHLDVIENELLESRKTLEFCVFQSGNILENDAEISTNPEHMSAGESTNASNGANVLLVLLSALLHLLYMKPSLCHLE